jgi:ATP-dependent helicase YprA (DUF1998 family)
VAVTRSVEPWGELLDTGRDDGRLVAEAREGPTKASWVTPPSELHPTLLAALGRAGIENLYVHQQRALQSAW